MKIRNIFLIVLALAVVRVFLAATMPVFDTSEARYAAISANMDRSGDFLVPRFTYNDRYQSFDGKPPLQFQLSGLSCRLFGRCEFSVRLPILLATLALLALLWRTVKELTDKERAALAVGIAFSSVAYYALAGCCMPDGLLTPCIASAYCFHVLYLKTNQRNWTLGVFAALALGMLTKGPVALVLFAFPVFADACFNHRLRKLADYRWIVGIPLFLAIAAPWFVLMSEKNPDFLRYFFINENLKRFLVHDYGDRYGAGREFFRGMALVWSVVITLPWTPIALFDLLRARQRGISRSLLGKGEESVFVWGILGITAFWCLTSRVPMAYLFPIVPLFAAFLAVRAEPMILKRTLPFAALSSAVIISSALVIGKFSSNKMLGAKAPYQHNRYSYEFYHGSPTNATEAIQ